VYYTEGSSTSCIVEMDCLSGQQNKIELDWGKALTTEQDTPRVMSEITVAEDGTVYGIVLVRAQRQSIVNIGYTIPYLCKFSPRGELIYATDIREQLQETGNGSWSSIYRMQVDEKGRACLAHPTRLFLYDENGNFDKVIPVNSDAGTTSIGVLDLVTGQDGNVYLYYYKNGYRLARINYETGELVSEQELLVGELFCFDAVDGFYVSDSDSLYRYDTTMPVAGRVAEKLFDWWDLSIFGEKVTMIGCPSEDCIIAVVFSTLEDRGGVYLIQKMPKWKAEEKGYIYAE